MVFFAPFRVMRKIFLTFLYSRFECKFSVLFVFIAEIEEMGPVPYHVIKVKRSRLRRLRA